MTSMYWSGNSVIIGDRVVQIDDAEVQEALSSGFEIIPEDLSPPVLRSKWQIERAHRLDDSDWRVTRAREQVELGLLQASALQSLLVYRQSLRDMTDATSPWPAIDVNVFAVLTPRQLRLVMLNIGLSDADIEAQIAAIADTTERAAAEIEWRWATQYERSHWLVEHLRVAMAFEEGEFDDLWRWGETL